MALDFDKLSDGAMTGLASEAFRLGLEHGRVHAKPVTASALLVRLGVVNYVWRNGHKAKLRQVYGVGFDISEMMKRVAKQESR